MTLETLLSNSAVQSLGTALLHFAWQGLLLAILLRVFLILTTRDSARLRYAAGCVVLFAMPLMLLMTATLGTRSAESLPSTAGSSILRLAPAPVIPPGDNTSEPVQNGIGVAGWAVAFWTVGILALSLQSGIGWARAQQLKSRSTAPAESQWMDALHDLMQRLDITRPVYLCTSAIAEVPAVVGWIRPFILLPVSALSGLGPREIEAVLAHELAHIRRHDYLVNLLQTAIETLLFYHPAVWWVSRQVRREREHCCDDIAVTLCGDVKLYAGALTRLEELRGRTPEPALAATGGELLGRIRRLLQPAPSGRRVPRFIGTAIATMLVMGAICVPAMLLLKAAPQQPAPVSPASPATARNPEPALTVERPLAIGRDNRVAFQEAQDLIRAVRVEQGKIFMDTEVKRVQSEAGTDALIKLYDSSQDQDVKRTVLEYLGERDSAKATDKLRAVAQSDRDQDIRRAAIDLVAHHAKSYEELVSLFESARDSEMRRAVLDYLGRFSDPRVLDKLLAIAQSDADPDIRRAAVDYISQR